MLQVSFDPFPILETGRLILSKPSDQHLEGLFRMRSNPEVMRFVPRPLAASMDDARAHLDIVLGKISDNTGINWAAVSKDDGSFVGLMGLFRIEPENYRAEIGYMMLPQFHGQGLMTEALSRIMDYGFDQMKLHSVEAVIDPENHASARVLEKNGFLREAHLKENMLYDGKFIDTVIYSKLNPADDNIYL